MCIIYVSENRTGHLLKLFQAGGGNEGEWWWGEPKQYTG
jgi:hypothetical protein